MCEPFEAYRRFKMNTQNNLRHTKYECKYHEVFIPKYRQKTLFKELRRYLWEVFHDLARQRENRIEEGHLLEDHVHMLVSIPPKHAVSAEIGFMKGKSAIHIARNYKGNRKNFTGQHFWARGF
jgi:putative transposase